MFEPSDEQKAMWVNPFDGDRGFPGDRVLSDKIVTAKKEHECHECMVLNRQSKTINKGERARRHVCIFGGNLETYYWHVSCLTKAYDDLTGDI